MNNEGNNETGVCWRMLTADDVCNTENKIINLIDTNNTADTNKKVGQLWILLCALKKFKEMERILMIVDKNISHAIKITNQEGLKCCQQHKAVLSELMKQGETHIENREEYTRIAARVQRLKTECNRYISNTNLSVYRKYISSRKEK